MPSWGYFPDESGRKEETEMKRKLLSLVMAVLMVLAVMVPMMALADEPEEGQPGDTTQSTEVQDNENTGNENTGNENTGNETTGNEGGNESGTTETTTTTSTKTGYIYNCKSYVNVRAKASSSSTKLGIAEKDAEYTILGTSGKWTKIQYTSTEVGWVFSTYIKVEESREETPAEEGATLTIVNCNYSVNVRADASSSSTKIGTAKKGAVYDLISTVKVGSKTWYKIQYTSSKVGYVFGTYGSTTGDTPSPIPGQKEVTINCVNHVIVRAKATSNSTKLGTADKGAVYPYIGKSGNWVEIQYTDTQVGYVYKTYAKISSGSENPETEQTGYGYVTGNTVNVRAGAGTSYESIGIAKLNEVYSVSAKSGNWYKISFGGQDGCISASYFNKVTSADKLATIVNCKENCNVRASASASGKLLGTAALGETYTYLKTSGSYYMISYDGKVGYVHKSYAQIG